MNYGDMTDEEAVTLHNLMVKYAKMDTFVDDWSITERNAFRDMATDLNESVAGAGCHKWPDNVN
jgi:hypothetical protein